MSITGMRGDGTTLVDRFSMPTRPGNSTASRALRSTFASGFSQGWRVLVTLGATLILRRYISAEDWGLFAWSLVVFMVLGAFRDLGLAYHVLRVEPRPFGNLLALELGWGGLLVVATFASAPWLAAINPSDHAATVGVLQALSLFLFLEGLSTVPRFYFDGELAVDRVVLPEVLRNLCFVGVAIAMAIDGRGVWSLVTAHVAAAALYCVLLWWRAWGEIPLHWERGRTWELVRTSLPLALIWFLLVLTRHIDPLVLGLMFPYAEIGNYTFAYEWATLASVQILLPAIGRTLYPTLLALSDRVKELFRAYSLATVLVITIEVSAALVLFLNADVILRLVGGDQWVAAPTYLRILCFAPLVDPFSRLGGEVLKARHLDRTWILSSLLTVLTFGVGGYALSARMGPAGMAWINLVPLGGLVMALALRRLDRRGFDQLCRQLAFIYLSALLAFTLAALVPCEQPGLRLAASLVAAAGCAGVVVLRYGARFRDFFT